MKKVKREQKTIEQLALEAAVARGLLEGGGLTDETNGHGLLAAIVREIQPFLAQPSPLDRYEGLGAGYATCADELEAALAQEKEQE